MATEDFVCGDSLGGTCQRHVCRGSSRYACLEVNKYIEGVHVPLHDVVDRLKKGSKRIHEAVPARRSYRNDKLPRFASGVVVPCRTGGVDGRRADLGRQVIRVSDASVI